MIEISCLDTHTSVTMLPDTELGDDYNCGHDRMMCLACGALTTRPLTWQLRSALTVRP